jgi:toxin ParE1/3/4
LRAIVRFTVEKWGPEQAVKYAQSLQNCFQTLADNPEMGRECNGISPGMRRHEHGKHVVFYLPQPSRMLIVRVLHQQIIPAKSRFEP